MISKHQLSKAVDEQIITADQAERLFAFFAQQSQGTPQFTFTHVLYYLGGLIAIGAMTLFMNLGWESFGGAGIVAIAALYAVVGLAITQFFAAKNLTIPAGICATFVVCLAPIAIYGLQQWWGVWPDDTVYREYHQYIKWHWLYMELGTLIVGLIIAWMYKYPFLVMPIAVTLWYMTMDIAAMLAEDRMTWELRSLVSMYTGLLMVALAFWVDIRSRHQADYAFWLYIFGVIAFWCGLTFQNSDSEVAKFLYCCINLLMIGVGVLLVRRVFVVFGAIGCCTYLGHLAENVFEDSWLFPMALTAIGLSIVVLGVQWQKHEHKITYAARSLLPQPMQELLERTR